MRDLEGRIALVTGAGRGLGRVCAQKLSARGAKVVAATITAENGEETVRLIRDAGGDAVFVQADISSSADVQRTVRTAVETYGRLDIAVNNAVRSIGTRPIADIDKQDWDAAMSVNLRGVFLSMKYEIRAMMQNGGGTIVNIGSGNEHTALPGHSWYMAAKQGIYGMTKVAALDYGRQGLRVNAVAPGPMWTPLLRDAAEKFPDHVEKVGGRTALGRVAEPEEVAEAVVWLASPAASYVTGITMSVDGGFVLG